MEDLKKFKIEEIIKSTAEGVTKYYTDKHNSDTYKDDNKQLPITDIHRDWVFNYQLAIELLKRGMVSPQNHKRCNRTGILGRRLVEGSDNEYTSVLCGCVLNKSIKLLAGLVEKGELNLPVHVRLRTSVRGGTAFSSYKSYLGLDILEDGKTTEKSESSTEATDEKG